MDKEILLAGIEALTQAIEEAPTASLYRERGRLHMLVGNHEEAMQDAKKATELDPTILNQVNGTFGAK